MSCLSNCEAVTYMIFNPVFLYKSHEVICNLLPDGAGGDHGGHSQREAQDLSYRHCGQPQWIGKTGDKSEHFFLGKTNISDISVISPKFNHN